MQAWLARHRHRDLTYQAFTLSEVSTRTAGSTAIVTARNNTRGSYQGHPIPEAVRATLILVADTGSWKLAAIHMSFIAGTPGAPRRSRGREPPAERQERSMNTRLPSCRRADWG